MHQERLNSRQIHAPSLRTHSDHSRTLYRWSGGPQPSWQNLRPVDTQPSPAPISDASPANLNHSNPCATHCIAARYKSCRSEEHTSELQSLMRISYAVFCLKTNKSSTPTFAFITDIPQLVNH